MQANVAWLLDRMRVNFADACVSGWERHQRSVTLPDPKDHHVVARVTGASLTCTVGCLDRHP